MMVLGVDSVSLTTISGEDRTEVRLERLGPPYIRDRGTAAARPEARMDREYRSFKYKTQLKEEEKSFQILS